MDDLSSAFGLAASGEWIRTRNDSLVGFNDNLHCFFVDRFFELHRYGIELKNERDVDDAHATYNLGVFRNSNPRGVVVPSIVISGLAAYDG